MGVARGSRDGAGLRQLLTRTRLVDWRAEDAMTAAVVRVDLLGRGRDMGMLDVLLAGHALSRGAAVATGNVRHFERVPGLAVENWRAAQSA